MPRVPGGLMVDVGQTVTGAADRIPDLEGK